MNHSGTSQMLRAVFDALPSRVFVVDQDVRIQEYNSAASELLLSDRMLVLKQRAGDILHCIHSTESPEGCGRASFCENCIIRNSVTETFHGKRIVRRRSRLTLAKNDHEVDIYALITTSPIILQGRSQALLVIEDISEIAELQRLIPICSVCKKVRDDKDSWRQIEAYFKDRWDVDFTHGLCPECLKTEKGRIAALRKPNQDRN